MFSSLCGLAIVVMATLLSGCGGDPYETAPVRGRVTTCEGKPAVGGTVVFAPIDAPEETGRPSGSPGQASEGKVGEDGTFRLTMRSAAAVDGALVGRHRVLFRAPPTKPPSLTEYDRIMLSLEEQKKTLEEFANWPVYPPIPCSGEITPGEVTVVRGENSFEFTLPPLPPGSRSSPASPLRSPNHP